MMIDEQNFIYRPIVRCCEILSRITEDNPKITTINEENEKFIVKLLGRKNLRPTRKCRKLLMQEIDYLERLQKRDNHTRYTKEIELYHRILSKSSKKLMEPKRPFEKKDRTQMEIVDGVYE